MGMKRFSAPPALYPHQPAPPPLTLTHPHPQPASPAPPLPAAPTTTATPSTPVSGWGGGNQQQQHQNHQHNPHSHPHPHPHPQPHPHHLHHHHHDPVGKRVKTEQTFESLFDKETHSDVTISVNRGESVFHAHRVILQMKSDVMAVLLNSGGGGDGGGGGGGGGGVESSGGGVETEGVVLRIGEGGRPVVHVQEDPECTEVFSRFLYFLYSGAVWLHQDYVLPLFRLAHRYKVPALRTHCQTYVLQVLAKSCSSPSSSSSSSSSSQQCQNNRSHHHNRNNNNSNQNQQQQQQQHYQNNNNHSNMNHNHSPAGSALSSPNGNSPPYAGSGFSLDAVCDLYEDEVYEGDIRRTAFRLLCCQFRQLVRSQRWLRCLVPTVCSLIASDACSVEENVILVAATDFMKRKQLADKRQIQDILALIRYPRLHRRVLYHLQKNGSFNNFPVVQELMLGAIKFHSFKDLPEAKDDFQGGQFRPRMPIVRGGGGGNNASPSSSSSSSSSSPNRRASMNVGAMLDAAYPPDLPSLSTVFVESAYSLEPDTVLQPVSVSSRTQQLPRQSHV